MRPRGSRPLARLRVVVALLIGLPLVLGTSIYLALVAQPAGAWRELMPAATFVRPQRSLEVLVLTRRESAAGWLPLYETTYLYPTGTRVWLVLQEAIRPEVRSGPGGWGFALAVDAAGRIHRLRTGPDGALQFEWAEGALPVIERLANGGLILAEGEDVLDAFQRRIPALIDRPDVLFFRDAFDRSDHDPSASFGTAIGPGLVPRVSAVVGLVVALTAGCALLARDTGRFRPTLVMLGVPVTALFLVWAVLLFGYAAPSLFPVLPYVLWLTVGTAVGWALLRRPDAPAAALGLPGLRSWARDRPRECLLLGLLLIAPVAYFGPRYTGPHLTLGDSKRYLQDALYIYEHGRWPLERVVADHGRTANEATYPPGPAVLMAVAGWVVGAEPDRLFFPGEQTSALWLLYAGFLVLAHLALLLAVIFMARGLAGQNPATWLVVALSVCWLVPSLRGNLHAAESLLWPLFASALVAALAWRETASGLAAGFAAALMVGLSLIKPEGRVLALGLLAPWVVHCAVTRRAPYPLSIGRLGRLVVLLVFAGAPAVILEAEKQALGVSARYQPVSVTTFLERLDDYLAALQQTAAVMSGLSGAQWTEHALIPPLAMLAALALGQLHRFSWRLLLVPAAVVVFLLGMPATYVFSSWQAVGLQIDVSWGRLLVPVGMVAGMYVLDTAVEVAREAGSRRKAAVGALAPG